MRIIYAAFLLSVIMLFQNCSPNQFSNAAVAESEPVVEQPAAVAEPAPVTPDPVTPTVKPACVAAGQKLFADRPFIYYRVCENERASWQQLANSYCCSGEATLIDVQTYADAQCAQGRIAGVAYCE